MDEPIVFKPLYMERVWGGRMLESFYGRDLPDAESPYGESWEVVDREDAQSIVDGGRFEGKSLHELWTEHRSEVFGEVRGDSDRFPLLVKILDARDRLSIQVHPPEEVAGELGGEPKTEMWYIAEADPGAALYVGLKKGVTREDFEQGLKDGRTEEQVHRIDTKADEYIFIPSGRLHAIGAGLLIFEIQQNSDTTYRVFDWNRVGLDGKPRDLHVEQSLRCIEFDDVEPTMGEDRGSLLVDCPLFRVERLKLPRGDDGRLVAENRSAVVAVVDGALSCGNRKFGKGDFFLLPPGRARISPIEDCSVLVSTLP